jgi:hypothetical protein
VTTYTGTDSLTIVVTGGGGETVVPVDWTPGVADLPAPGADVTLVWDELDSLVVPYLEYVYADVPDVPGVVTVTWSLTAKRVAAPDVRVGIQIAYEAEPSFAYQDHVLTDNDPLDILLTADVSAYKGQTLTFAMLLNDPSFDGAGTDLQVQVYDLSLAFSYGTPTEGVDIVGTCSTQSAYLTSGLVITPSVLTVAWDPVDYSGGAPVFTGTVTFLAAHDGLLTLVTATTGDFNSAGVDPACLNPGDESLITMVPTSGGPAVSLTSGGPGTALGSAASPIASGATYTISFSLAGSTPCANAVVQLVAYNGAESEAAIAWALMDGCAEAPVDPCAELDQVPAELANPVTFTVGADTITIESLSGPGGIYGPPGSGLIAEGTDYTDPGIYVAASYGALAAGTPVHYSVTASMIAATCVLPGDPTVFLVGVIDGVGTVVTSGTATDAGGGVWHLALDHVLAAAWPDVYVVAAVPTGCV